MKKIKVVKFGGSSISTLTHFGLIDVMTSDYPNSKIVCVLSAEQNVTDTLIEEYNQLLRDCSSHSQPLLSSTALDALGLEYDLHVSYGEIKSIWKASVAAKYLGLKSIPLSGWQAGIQTNDVHKNAEIRDINTKYISSLFRDYDIIFVAGFQGLTPSRCISTLGRGASDLTAVALAASLNLADVTIYTDVEGVSTIDPRLLSDFEVIKHISYEEALELSAFGNKVIQQRAVSLAQKYCIDINIKKASKEHRRETTISSSININKKRKSRTSITGIAVRQSIAQYNVSIPNRPGQTSILYSSLLDNLIPASSLSQGFSADRSLINFFLDNEFCDVCTKVLDALKKEKKIDHFSCISELSEITLVGQNLATESGYLPDIYNCLSALDITPKFLSTAGIRVTVVIKTKHLNEAIESLHNRYFSGGK